MPPLKYAHAHARTYTSVMKTFTFYGEAGLNGLGTLAVGKGSPPWVANSSVDLSGSVWLCLPVCAADWALSQRLRRLLSARQFE